MENEYLLLEDGFRLLYEDGGGIVLQTSGLGQWIEQDPAAGVWDEAAASLGTWVEQ